MFTDYFLEGSSINDNLNKLHKDVNMIYKFQLYNTTVDFL